jgi:hypothetical protein
MCLWIRLLEKLIRTIKRIYNLDALCPDSSQNALENFTQSRHRSKRYPDLRIKLLKRRIGWEQNKQINPD